MRPFKFQDSPDDIQEIQRVSSDIEPTTMEYYKTLASQVVNHNMSNKIKTLGDEQFANRKQDYSGYGTSFGDSETLSTYEQIFAPKELSTNELNAKYGIPGALTFDRPLTEASAQMKYNRMRKDIERQDVLNRYTHSNAIINFGVETAVSMLDPLNLALMFVPGIGEAKFAEMGFGTIGSRLASGATQGAFGMAAAEPLNIALDSQLGYKHTVGDAVNNIMLGAAMGAGIHTVMRGVGDLIENRVISRNTHEQAVKTAVSQVVEGKDVRVDPIIKAEMVTDDMAVKYHDIETALNRKQLTTVDEVKLNSFSREDLNITKKAGGYEVSFKNESGRLTGTKGFGSNITEAMNNLKEDYTSLLADHNTRTETLSRLKSKYSEMNSSEYSSRFIEEKAAKEGAPIEQINKESKTLADLVAKREEMTSEKPTTKQGWKEYNRQITEIDKSINMAKENIATLKSGNTESYNTAKQKLASGKLALRQKIKNLEDIVTPQRYIDEIQKSGLTPDSVLNELQQTVESQMATDKPTKQKELKDIIKDYPIQKDVDKLHKFLSDDIASLEQAARDITGDNTIFDKINEEYSKIEKDLKREADGIMSAVNCIINKEL